MERDGQASKTLVWICGPPAVGKMTVGIELSDITGFPLFHNHLSIEAVLPVFRYGSPPFNRVVARFRDSVFVEAARSDLPGLIYTMVWAFDHPGDLEFVAKQKAVLHEEGYQMDSSGAFPFPDCLRIDNTRVEPRAVAERIAAHFGFV